MIEGLKAEDRGMFRAQPSALSQLHELHFTCHVN